MQFFRFIYLFVYLFCFICGIILYQFTFEGLTDFSRDSSWINNCWQWMLNFWERSREKFINEIQLRD